MARKKYEEDNENHERWLISYADFITLLFAFFVVMYAISVVNEGKYRVFSDSLGDAFGRKEKANPGSAAIEPLIPMDNIAARRKLEALRREQSRLSLLAKKLDNTLSPLVKAGKVSITQTGRGVTVDINASALFAPGEATITSEARQPLHAIAQLLAEDSHEVQVEGHTDSAPISNSVFPSNWELSAARASSVVRLFIDSGMPAGRLTAVGHAANVPIALNDTPEGRTRNRRVAVTIMSSFAGTR
ncbi:flagellar motor protein MotD [Massilia sp. GCM10020059]|uniref:Flagellar motor protein MotD n=1 Tax=Massilia agrisoli TaxID=2892444 RepID=A0ABS8IRP2_9BURK|nr:flagellar motor protein MotD [Massilia agrisoli]MCC6071300.1 flagellar motor protein MotD [Massilia agrisoli]